MKLRPVATMALMLAVAAPVLAGCSLFDLQRDLILHDVVNALHDGRDVTTHAEDTTDTVCVAPLECVEAYSTAEADYVRFDNRKSAEEYGATVQDEFVVNYFVMDFEGKDASVETQLEAMQVLAGMWNDYAGGFPDRGQLIRP